MTVIQARQKQRYDTAANWTSNNPLLLAGELGIESDTKKMKVGDGITLWASLDYVVGFFPTIDDIGDVDFGVDPLQTGQVLVWGDNKWRPGPIIGGYTPIGSDPYWEYVEFIYNHGSALTGQTAIPNDASTSSVINLTSGTIIENTQTPISGYNSICATSDFYFNDPSVVPSQVNGAFTYEAWVYVGGTYDPRLIEINANSLSYVSINSGTTVTLRFLSGGSLRITHQTNMSLNTWHHVAVSKNASNVWYIYLDGVRSTSGYTTWATSANTSVRVFQGDGTQNFFAFPRLTLLDRYSSTNFTPETEPYPVGDPYIPYSIGGLDDVDITTTAPEAEQTLIWDAVNTKFIPGNVIGKKINSTAPPASATDTGTAGEIRYDTNYVYICTATDTWVRASLATW